MARRPFSARDTTHPDRERSRCCRTTRHSVALSREPKTAFWLRGVPVPTTGRYPQEDGLLDRPVRRAHVVAGCVRSRWELLLTVSSEKTRCALLGLAASFGSYR